MFLFWVVCWCEYVDVGCFLEYVGVFLSVVSGFFVGVCLDVVCCLV